MRSYQVTVFESPLVEADEPTPVPTGAEVLVKITAAGVCHSDLHICDGFYDIGGGKKFRMADRGVVPPITMGHEIAGEIVAAGPDSDAVTPGEKVVVYPWIGCGTCPACRRGNENLCTKPRFLGIFLRGGYATHVIVPHARYCLPTGGLPAAVAAPYACSGLTTWSALKKIDPDILAGEPILIIGAGGLGLMCLSLMKALGAKGAIVADIDPVKRQAALDAGALAAVDPREPDAAARVRAMTEADGGVPATIDLVGAGTSVQFGIDCSARGGKVIVVGLIGGELTLPVPMLPQRALTIQGSYIGSLGELTDLMAFVAKARPAAIPITTTPLDKVNDALDALRAGKVIGRIVLEPHAA